MAALDDIIKSYDEQLEQSNQEFISDVEELRNEGISATEVLLFLAALDVTSYFTQDLGMSNAINSYMGGTTSVLDELPFFGRMSEEHLLALQNIQRSNIVGVTNKIGESVRMSIAQGVSNNLDRNAIGDLIRRNLGRDMPRIDTIITSSIGVYQQSVIGAMAKDLPEDTLWRYDGPRDEKNRALCREYLNKQPLTQEQITSINPNGYYDRGGYNCRHLWLPVD
tara:strand:+ start:30 stop:698 length:669 start_codon:yes stop_codon:yes gene_type:complete